MEHQDSTDEPSSKETIQTQKPENIISGIYSEEMFKGYLGQMFFDRTDYIPLLIGGPRVKIITAPHLSGKSCLCSMMSNFLSIRDDWECSRVKNYEIFKQLTIGKDEQFMEKHCGKYPVIRLDLYFADNNYEDVLSSLRSEIHYEYLDHEYLSDSNVLRKDQKRWIRKWSDGDRYHNTTERDIIEGLKNLTECLRVHHGQKCYILIDGICNRILCYISSEDLNKFCKLLNSVMSCLLQENEDNIAGGIVTGVSLLFYGDLPCFKDVACYRFLHDHEFERYFVFSEDEVSNLLTKYKENFIEPDLAAIKKHYGGYVTKSGIEVYFPWLIMRYAGPETYEKYPYYWPRYSTVTTILLRSLNLPFLRKQIFNSFSGASMRVNLLTTLSQDNLRSVNEALRDERLFLHMDHNIALSFLVDEGFFSLDHALTETDANGKMNHFIKIANHNVMRNCRLDMKNKWEEQFFYEMNKFDESNNLKLNVEHFLLWLYNKLYDGPPENSCNVTTLTKSIALGVEQHSANKRDHIVCNGKIKVYNAKTNTFISDYVNIAFKYRGTKAFIVKIGVGKSAEMCAKQMRDNNHLKVLQEFDSMKNVTQCLVLALAFSTLEDKKKVVFDGLYQLRDASDLSPLEIDKMESAKLSLPYWSQ